MNSQKKKKKFNIIDLFIVIALICCISFAVNVIFNDLFNAATQNITYVIKVEGVTENSIGKLSENDRIYAGSYSTNIGSVSKVEAVPSKAITFDYINNRYKENEISGICDLYITVNAVAEYKNNFYNINGIKISANTNPGIVLPFIFDKSEIIAVTVNE